MSSSPSRQRIPCIKSFIPFTESCTMPSAHSRRPGICPIGCELAQAFQRLGSQVCLLHKNAHLLDREDAEAAAIVQSAFIREGMAVRLNARTTRVERNGSEKLVRS